MKMLLLFFPRKRNLGKYNVVLPGNVSQQQRVVPDHILKPPYFETGAPPSLSFTCPEVKNQSQIEGMRRACQVAQQVLEGVGQEVKVSYCISLQVNVRYFWSVTTIIVFFALFQIGKTTDDLDIVAHKLIIDANAYPSPLNYKGFPKSICTSVNNVCCHGIPDDRSLEDGDIVNVDVTVSLNCLRVYLVCFYFYSCLLPCKHVGIFQRLPW